MLASAVKFENNSEKMCSFSWIQVLTNLIVFVFLSGRYTKFFNVGSVLHLLSLDEPRALGLVLVVAWSVTQITRGPRQPGGEETEETQGQ